MAFLHRLFPFFNATRFGEQELRLFFNSMHNGVAIYEPVDNGRDFVFVDMNASGLRFAGLKRKEVVGRKLTDVFPGVRKMGLFDALQRVSRTGQSEELPLARYQDARVEQWVENHVFRLPSGQVVAMFNDVTDRKQFEGQVRFQADVLSQIHDLVTVTDLDGRITYVNQAVCKHFNKTAEELIGLSIEQYGDVALQRTIIRETLEKGVWRGEVVSVALQQDLLLDCRVVLMKDEAGDPVALVSVSTDITERRRQEKQLAASKERFQMALDGGRLGTWDWQVQTGEVVFDERWVQMLGFTLDEISPDFSSWENLTHPDDMPAVREKLNAHLEGRSEVYEAEMRMRHKSGEWIWILDRGRVIERDEDGRPLRACGTHMDITDAKRSAMRLLQSEERYRLLAENLPGIVFLCDHDDRWTMHYVNSQIEQITGYHREEFLSGRIVFSELIHPDDKTGIYRDVQAAVDSHQSFHLIYRIIHRNGTIRWVEERGDAVRKNDEVRHLERYLVDITRQKEVELKLKESESRLAVATQSAGIGIWDRDVVNNVLKWDERMFDLYGVKPEEFGGAYEAWQRGIHPDDLERASAAVLSAERGEKPYDTEFRIVRPDGEIRHIKAYAEVLRDADGNALHMIGVNYDITDRKLAEEHVQRALGHLKKVADQVPGMIYQYKLRPDGTACFPYSSGKIKDVYRVTPEQVREDASAVLAVFHPDDYDDVVESIQASAHDLTLWNHEYRVQFDDGTVHWLHGRAMPQREEDGSVLWYGFVTDITGRRAMEEQMRLMQFGLDHSVTEIVLINPDGTFNYVNDAACRAPGYEREELLGLNIMDIVADLTPDKWNESLKDLRERKQITFEARRYNKDGSICPVEVTINYVEYNGREYNFAFARDITERRVYEKELWTQRARYRELAKHLEAVREEERKRLSRELHDDIGQVLTALKIDLTLLVDQSADTDFKSRTADMQGLLSEGIQSVHSLCRRLRPGALDDLGLVEAIEGFIEDWKRRNRAECELVVEIPDGELSDEVKTAIFRMVQEALTNVSRYANASMVNVCLTTRDNMLCCAVRDNGIGIEDGAEAKPTSFGLLGMRERVEVLGGMLEVCGKRGRGTCVEACVPIA